eukprot:TRINITY_DN123764_c0_g1_i1.p1 TRINITY_DN123764_c0_g1~~TRINITY_DN123764_c0_g1_i1.p1  ORF type:complete len:153 (+),score=16.54 TRINITY_DN123764_c0_g1_i1:3-461(+)
MHQPHHIQTSHKVSPPTKNNSYSYIMLEPSYDEAPENPPTAKKTIEKKVVNEAEYYKVEQLEAPSEPAQLKYKDLISSLPLAEPEKIVGIRNKRNGKKGFEYALQWQLNENEAPFISCCSTEQVATLWPRLLIDFLEKHIEDIPYLQLITNY